jgi:phosphatidate phosphatase APP1
MADEFTVVSDIDDVVRITKVYVPTTGLKNSFAEPYVNIAGMPELYAHWMQTLPGAALHFDTTTPLELSMPAYCSVSALTVRKARTYVDYLFANYPLGSLDMRPINLTEPSDVLDARSKSLQRIFQTFPNRKFVLVGDTSSSTLLTAYPEIAQMVGLSISSRDLLTRTQYPSQLACIFIRNTTATDSDDSKRCPPRFLDRLTHLRRVAVQHRSLQEPQLQPVLLLRQPVRPLQPRYRRWPMRQQLDSAECNFLASGRTILGLAAQPSLCIVCN